MLKEGATSVGGLGAIASKIVLSECIICTECILCSPLTHVASIYVLIIYVFFKSSIVKQGAVFTWIITAVKL